MQKYTIAVVGAMGAVGREMLKTLEQRNFPVKKIKPLDIPSNAGKKITFQEEPIAVEAAVSGAFKDVDIALFSAGADASKVLAPTAVTEGAVVIDNSSAWRMDENVPLVIPEVNPEDLSWHKGLIANPNCSTIQMLVALKPLHDRYNIKRIVVSTYQAVSGTGQKAIVELNQQVQDYVTGQPIKSNVYPYQIAFNALPHIDVFLENGYSKEEMKMVFETKKIMDKNISVSATTVRIPVFRSHSESINIETEKPFKIDEVVTTLNEAPGIIVVDNLTAANYPLAIDAEGKDEVFVGRIRRDFSIDNGLNLWVVADNLRKGAALNAIQIAETLVQKALI
ncbi:aspartate-semialdehyde dehydrogenase [Geosporobacter ferrireducens]|uniref:Aspartate-semialdehyde dehydrogenase n=1 Tax=Geosporobacter ferrireducens TaxID=1424294 RepID=A0A1D8GPG1_9FIRM|nr:aspartate-semialdehyde dehydrogenase [Geosporobacter ferrireducens]AOT72644.1 aspartate-semialdehyde dehydrogenase [Geosporobacter ferrireducens]MTI55048.1 aspartate-semialdehyde dehydrogenase [Geosporobacter ferrireducens]